MQRIEQDLGQVPLTTAELGAKPDVTPGDIITTLWGCAESGYGIRGEAVIAAIDRADPDERDLRDIQEAAIGGIIGQAKNPVSSSRPAIKAEQAEYAQVVGHVGLRLDQLAQ